MPTPLTVDLARYDFLTVLVGVLLGLSIAKLLAFVGELLSCRKAPEISAPHAVYLALMFLMQVHYWWSFWEAKEVALASYFGYLYLLALPVLMYLATAVLCPDGLVRCSDGLSAFYYEQARTFFILAAAILVVGALQSMFLWRQSYGPNSLRVVAALVILPAAVSQRPPIHLAVACTLTVMFVLYVFVFSNFRVA